MPESHEPAAEPDVVEGGSRSQNWPETVGLAVLVGALALLASGWLDPILPWAR